MQRRILGFGRDAEDDWCARLACGHNRHVRHRPPFINRPWVMHAAGRASWLGRTFDCLRCDRLEWPAARVFEHCDDADVRLNLSPDSKPIMRPAAADGYWQRIRLETGRARLVVDAIADIALAAGDEPAAIPPGLNSRIEPRGQHATGRVSIYRLI